ncbi:MAG: phage major capsid protein, partial [Pseudomonadota bacterium]
MTQMDPGTGLETKVAGAQTMTADVAGAFDDFMMAFDQFKQANDERLDEIERRMTADVVTTDKVDRINAHLDEQKRVIDTLSLKARRPQIGDGGEIKDLRSAEHKEAFEAYVRKGETGELRGLEAKALSVQSDPDGGYLVPDETETEVGRLLAEASPIRAIAG